MLGAAPDARYQFERTGYFVKDVADWRDERPVFNRTVTLRDTWAKVAAAGVATASANATKVPKGA